MNDEEKLLANQQVIKTPIVRNGKQATVGYEPTVWKVGHKIMNRLKVFWHSLLLFIGRLWIDFEIYKM